MIPKELEDLIKEYLTDGIISSQERKVLLRKAEQMGLDIEEVDLYITAQEQKVENKESEKKKATFGKRCPQCGKQVESMTLRCECGYEFVSRSVSDSINSLVGKLEHLKSPSKRCEAISMFPVPNTKEDIIEVLSMAAANSKKRGGLFSKHPGLLLALVIVFDVIVILGILISVSIWGLAGIDDESMGLVVIGSILFLAFTIIPIAVRDNQDIQWNKTTDAWRAKFNQVLMKGRTLRGDSEFSQMLDYFEKQVRK